jgi:hypothetical protein
VSKGGEKQFLQKRHLLRWSNENSLKRRDVMRKVIFLCSTVLLFFVAVWTTTATAMPMSWSPVSGSDTSLIGDTITVDPGRFHGQSIGFHGATGTTTASSIDVSMDLWSYDSFTNGSDGKYDTWFFAFSAEPIDLRDIVGDLFADDEYMGGELSVKETNELVVGFWGGESWTDWSMESYVNNLTISIGSEFFGGTNHLVAGVFSNQDALFTTGGSINFTANGDMDVAPVPEPATMLLFGAGLAGLVGIRTRKKKN